MFVKYTPEINIHLNHKYIFQIKKSHATIGHNTKVLLMFKIIIYILPTPFYSLQTIPNVWESSCIHNLIISPPMGILPQFHNAINNTTSKHYNLQFIVQYQCMPPLP